MKDTAVVTVPRAYMTGVVTVVVNPLSSKASLVRRAKGR